MTLDTYASPEIREARKVPSVHTLGEPPPSPPLVRGGGTVEDQVTIVIKTLLRPESLRRSLRSIRKRLPRIPILVADDSGYRSLDSSEFADVGAVTSYYLLPKDSGASYGRNFLVRQVQTPYVMVVDDDTLFDEDTRLEAAWRVLETTPQLDLVAGYYRPARWWGSFEVDEGRGVLRQVFERPRGVVQGFPVYDFVPQFYVARTAKIRAVGWDDELKTLDHLQFFWRARGRLNATVLPYFSAFNTSERSAEYDAFRWQRVPFYRRLQLRKLGLRGIEDVAAGSADGVNGLDHWTESLDPRALADPAKKAAGVRRRTLVVGLGTGRCGTVSLSKVLGDAFGVACISHERPPLLPWLASAEDVWRHCDALAEGGGEIFGDVAFYYLPHVETIRQWARRRGVRVRWVCMRRDRQGTIDSYLAKVASYGANHWMNHDGKRWNKVPPWDACYPKFDHCQDLEEALGAYWDAYQREAETLAVKHPDTFRIFDLEALNDSRALHSLVHFVAPPGKRVLPVEGARLNTAATTHALARRREESSGLPIWFINLDRCGDRRRHMEEQLQRVGAHAWRRLPALDGEHIDDAREGTVDGVAYRNRLAGETPKADLAALLSHLQAARRLLDSPHQEQVCVMEDDMVFEGFDGWPGHRLSDLLAAAPAGWNMLQLQCNNTDVLHWLALCRRREAFVRRHLIDPVFKVWGAGAYVLNRRGARALMDRFWRHDHFLLDGASFLAVERLLYDIPGVHVATDAFFVANDQPSLIAPHHDAVDRSAARLSRTLFGGDVESDVPLVIRWSATDDGDDAIDQDPGRRGFPARHRVRLRPIRRGDLPADPSARLQGEVWGTRYENRCRERGSREELARLLSWLKAAYFVAGVGAAGALLLEAGVDAERLGRRLTRMALQPGGWRGKDIPGGGHWLAAEEAKAVVDTAWRADDGGGRFVLDGRRPAVEEIFPRGQGLAESGRRRRGGGQ